MESWIQAVVEWINCLSICDRPISHIQQLQDNELFYSKLIKQLKHAGGQDKINDVVDISTFMEHEYPEIVVGNDDNVDNISKQVYLASLLLLSASQKESFHRPMYTLRNETQILIKRFLELILPYGQGVTLDIIRDTILELSDITPRTPPQTPKDRPLKNFLASPAAHSAYRHRMMNERTRELHVLKAQLDTERFEKADLQEDLKTLEDKVHHLQQKLESKTQELKYLRIERTQPVTPKSVRKNKKNGNVEEYLRKEVEHLELFNAKLQGDVDRLEGEHENLTRRLTSKERFSDTLKHKVDEYEREMETLTTQLEMKTNDLLDLRMQNEELRAHIKGIQRYSIDAEQSFEVEHISRARSPSHGLNVSEAASSIIDIQLKESHEESARLKAELNSLQQTLDQAVDECNELKHHKQLLDEKILLLDEVQMTLEITEDKLSKRDCQLNVIQMEKQSLQDDLKKLQDTIRNNEVTLKNGEAKKCELESEISNLNKELNNLKISLVTTEDTLAQIHISKEVLDMKLVSFEEKINVLEKSLTTKTKECEEVTRISQDKIGELEKNIVTCSNEKDELERNLDQKNRDLKRVVMNLADKDSEINLLKTNVSRLENQLTSNQSALSGTEIKLCELNELRDELQSQLVQERENATALFAKKCELESSLSTAEATNTEYSGELSSLKENFSELQRKYDDLREKLRLNEENYVKEREKADSLYSEKENLTTQLNNVNSELSELKNIQENLQNRLTQVQESCIKLVTEKSDLEHTIAMSERQSIDQSEKISMLQSRVDKSQAELEQIHTKFDDSNAKYTEANDRIENLLATIATNNCTSDLLNKKVAELEDIETQLKAELKVVQDDVEILSADKITLEIALSSRDDDKKKLTAEITSLQADLDKFRSEIEERKSDHAELKQKYEDSTEKILLLNEEIQVINDKYREITVERDCLMDEADNMTKELRAREIKSNEMQLQIDELRQVKERMINSHQDHQNASNELIGSLEKRLLATQNNCESLKLDAKLHEDSLTALKSKLEQTTNEKIESELKMKEVIVGLQEVRSSQDSVLQAQAKALNDKISEFEVFEKQHLKIKAELQSQLDLKTTRNEELLTQCTTLEESADRNKKIIQELEETKKVASDRLEKLQEVSESAETDMKTIEVIYEMLLCKNNDQDDIDVLKQSWKHPATQKLAGKLEEVCAKFKATREMVSQLQEENDSLKKSNEDNKVLSSIVLAEAETNTKWLNQVNSTDDEWDNRNIMLTNLLQKKEDLQVLLKDTIASRNELDNNLSRVRESWDATSCEVKRSIAANSSPCDELKHMEAKRMEIEHSLNELNDSHSEQLKPLLDLLCRVFMLSDNKINELYAVPLQNATTNIAAIDFADEVSVLQLEIETNETMLKDLIVIDAKIDQLRGISNAYESNIKTGIVKREVIEGDKLQIQLERVTKEKKELKDKMDAARVRNARMEKNMDELRSENKKLKAELSEVSSTGNTNLEQLTTQIEQLQNTVELLEKEQVELARRPKEEDFDNRLKDIHNEYGEKLERIKQKMKIAYGEQIAKLNIEQEKAMSEKVASMRAKMEQQCKKYSEDIAKYKAHISDMSSQFWDVGEKLLAEKQEKQVAMQRYEELRKTHQLAMNDANQSIQSAPGHNQLNAINVDRDYVHERVVHVPPRSSFRAVQVIEEQTTTTRRHSVKSIQAMGNAFSAEDEEGEVFDNVYLADLKEGKFRGIDTAPDFDRMSELRMRNSLCRPHLKSSYAVETHFHPLGLTEEDIKSGPINEDTFNDSLSQSLLPGQKMKKKDRTQTSYKRPGPPTPSKNGGRLSLQGNELKSPNSRILRERNSERRTTSTPKRLKDFFGTTLSRRQDENAPATPRGRRLSNIFRKTRTTDKS